MSLPSPNPRTLLPHDFDRLALKADRLADIARELGVRAAGDAGPEALARDQAALTAAWSAADASVEAVRETWGDLARELRACYACGARIEDGDPAWCRACRPELRRRRAAL